VEQGKVVELCAEPGEYTYDSSTEPSIFAGKLGNSILESFKTLGKRFAYGGDTGKDQRVYYFNTKELLDNKFGTPNPIPFRVVDARAGIDIDISIRCFGEYSYRICDPILFYKNVSSSVAEAFTRDAIDGQLKKVATNTFVITPCNVDVSGEQMRSANGEDTGNFTTTFGVAGGEGSTGSDTLY
jgi:membrane protease subunit (stomatin/prohibitin family)